MINAITVQLAANNDPLGTANTLAPLYKSLNTLGIYDQRRRRAAKAVEDRLTALQKEKSEAQATHLAQAAQTYLHFQSLGEPFNPTDLGFVCSQADIDAYLLGQSLGQSRQKP